MKKAISIALSTVVTFFATVIFEQSSKQEIKCGVVNVKCVQPKARLNCTID